MDFPLTQIEKLRYNYCFSFSFLVVMLTNTTLHRLVLSSSLTLICTLLYAQQITGVWNGKIDRKKVEIKIIQNGDSLTGTSYYYESPDNYRRYSIKGHFDAQDNSVVWWDDQLIEDKGSGLSGRQNLVPLVSVADFNCPGGPEMFLDGKTSEKDNPDASRGTVALTKTGDPYFPDEWDFVVNNYTIGANDPTIIDSIFMIAFTPVQKPARRPVIKEKPAPTLPPLKPGTTAVAVSKTKVAEPQIRPLTIEEKFIAREKVVATEIQLEGDSIELRFYDNAEIDGDSISLFLNSRLLFTHIRLSDKAYTIKLPVKDLEDRNELTMVAENLGSIPPNTSFMVALVGERRYEAKLASTENSSAMIRLFKNPDSLSAVSNN
jgi:hypothetical protein